MRTGKSHKVIEYEVKEGYEHTYIHVGWLTSLIVRGVTWNSVHDIEQECSLKQRASNVK